MKHMPLAAALILAGATPILAQTPWIHVAVDESGESPTRVNVNLPLSVVRIAMRAAPDDIIADGKIRLDRVDRDLEVESLRAMWEELRLAEDGELVTVEDRDEIVRIRREGERILIDIEDRHETDRERVRVDLPTRVVDALLSGDDESLDIERAFDELSKERGDIVHVDGGDTTVRVWIDERD